MLELRDVAFGYDDRRVLDGVSLELRAGRVVGLLGPNGAGKSTLVRLAAGLLRPARGSVWLAGRDLRSWRRREVARRLALLPQDGAMPPAFTGREIALMGRTPHLGWLAAEGPADRDAVERALALADAAAFADRRVGELSGGERQRLLLARALSQEPSVLLLDEPTVHLDLGHQLAMLELVVDLARRRDLAVLAVYHDLNLAAQSCDELLVLHGGRIAARGAPDEVLRSELVAAVYGVELELVQRASGRAAVLLPESRA
jgi:ABC-type cobalamin/Fe3+-siderophores transport system ATPase subunit